MPNLVRVKLKSGTEVSVGASLAEKHNLKVVDKPAVGPDGAALAAKPKTSVAEAAATSKTSTKSTSS